MIRRYIIALLFILTLSVFQKAYSFYVVGYFPSWGSFSVNNIRYDKFTHINYAFITPNSNGTVSTVNSTKVNSLVSQAHSYNVKVLIAIGGASNGSAGFSTIVADQNLRTSFATNLLAFVNTYNMDGVDVDWEFPSSAESANYNLMMKEIADTLHKHGKILTAAVSSWGSNADVIPNEVFDYIDFLNLMAYDAGTPHSTYAVAASSIIYWQDRGLPADKTVLGVPFYGRTPYSSYSSLVAQDPMAPYKDNVGSIYYNGIVTMKNKTSLAISKCAGIMIWEISQDTSDDATSLLSAIYSVILAGTKNKAPEKDGFNLFPNPSSDHVTIQFNSTTATDVNISISNILGNEVLQQTFTKSGGDFLQPIDIETLPTGVYLIKVQAGDRVMVRRLTVRD